MAHQPLLEPAALVSENCPDCRGTGRMMDKTLREPREVECSGCEGAGRVVREVPLSELWVMAQQAHALVVAPPPSMLRADR